MDLLILGVSAKVEERVEVLLLMISLIPFPLDEQCSATDREGDVAVEVRQRMEVQDVPPIVILALRIWSEVGEQDAGPCLFS